MADQTITVKQENIAETTERLVNMALGPRVIDTIPPRASCVPFLMVPKDCDLKTFEHLLPHPLRANRQHRFVTLDSFIAYLDKFKTPQTELFQLRLAGFQGIFNYHGVEPGWSDDLAMYLPEFSDELKAWLAKNNQAVGQNDFCEFIQDWSSSFVSPDGARMLEICRQLETHKEVDFTSNITLANGDVKLGYQEVTKEKVGNGDMTFPSNLVLGLQVYPEGVRYEVAARLRYETANRKLCFRYKLHRPADVVDDALKEMREKIEKGLGQPVWRT